MKLDNKVAMVKVHLRVASVWVTGDKIDYRDASEPQNFTGKIFLSIRRDDMYSFSVYMYIIRWFKIELAFYSISTDAM